MRKIILVFSIAFLAASTVSCVSKRKIADMNKSIEKRKKHEQKLDSTILALNNFRTEKNAVGELDDKSNQSIKTILDLEKKGIQQRTDSLNKMQEMLSGKRVKVKEFKNMITLVTSGTTVVNQKAETINFVDKLLNQQTFIKFNTAAFFNAGGYKIPTEKMDEAKKVFSPIVDSLIVFVTKFPNIKLSTSIVASGFADGQGFGAGALVDELTANIGKAVATKEELNTELSKLRAEEVSGILMEIFKEKIKNMPSAAVFDTNFFKIGKGEDYPNKKITDYQTDDERRRIVVIYWNAIPK
jgi:hypothetical protein